MDEAGVLRELVSQFGTAGLIIAYLVWDRWTTGKERRDLDKQQIDSNIRLAETLAALETVILEHTIAHGRAGGWAHEPEGMKHDG